jgi:hypothetical protein
MVFAMAALAVAGCRKITDYNNPCLLIHRCDAGVCPFTEGEVLEKTAATKDFISFGAVECDNLTCVRDSSYPSGTALDQPAQGYCSSHCGSPSEACPSFDERLDQVAATKLHCRALLLDEEVLAAIKSDPELSKLLGNTTAPYFCARGSPDAGK